MHTFYLAALVTANTLQQWSLLVGLLLPVLVAFIQQPRWSDHVRALVGVASCVVAGVVTTLLQQGWDWSDWFGSTARILVAAQATYVAFWKPTGIAPWFEKLTSPDTPKNRTAHTSRTNRRKHPAVRTPPNR